jgi:hypothetical protein
MFRDTAGCCKNASSTINIKSHASSTIFLPLKIVIIIHNVLAGIANPDLLLMTKTRPWYMGCAFIVEYSPTDSTVMFSAES